MNAVPVRPAEVFQNALTLLIDSVCAHFHAASLSGSSVLMSSCAEIARQRKEHADALARIIERNGWEPELESSGEARFQRIWMALVNRRFPTFRDGLPRECLRTDRALVKALAKLANQHDLERGDREQIQEILAVTKASVARIESLRDTSEELVPSLA